MVTASPIGQNNAVTASLVGQNNVVTASLIGQNETVAALKKARQQYLQRSEDLEKTRAVTAKAGDELTAGHKTLDKRRKSRDDAQSKVWYSGSNWGSRKYIPLFRFTFFLIGILGLLYFLSSCDSLCLSLSFSLSLSHSPHPYNQVMEAEMQYRQCVCEAQDHQDKLESLKEKIIVHTRKLICQGDTVLKEVGVKAYWR